MPQYNLPVLRPRGAPENVECKVVDTSATCTNGIILYGILGRVTLNDGTVHEFETIFDPETNAIDVDIPEEFLSSIETIGIGPNLQRYFEWLLPQFAVTAVTVSITPYQAIPGDIILVDTSVGDITIDLPSVLSDIKINIKKIGGNFDVIIDPGDGVTIDNDTTLTISNQYNSVALVCDGSNWWII